MQGLQEWLLSNSRREEQERCDDEEREVIRRRMRTEKWTLDRGAGYYATERVKKKHACLVQTGKHAGQSRVKYVGVDFQIFWKHVLRRDFFTTALNAKLVHLVGLLVLWYYMMLLGWATFYYVIWRFHNNCFIGFHGFRSAFMYATETQQTIGYGERATGECWVSALAVAFHSLQAVLLDSVILGIVFSRISHPKQRSRTVLITDCACIARRDGQLKFMFRVADIQRRSVIDPRIHVVMYTWGPGRRTAEGEHIPVTAQDMSCYMDRALILPATVEHNIDEASPLFGHTLASLEAVAAEIVVTFEASTEQGNTFMSRQSYLPSEIHWGHTFVSVVRAADGGETQHEVDISRFHDVEPQPSLGDEMTQPHRLSRKVVAGVGSSNAIPPRLLFENTLVLSECAVITCRNGRPYLMFRLGDTFAGQVLDVQVTAHLYRWQVSSTSEGEMLPYEEYPLELEPINMLLRYPVTLMHELDPARSPVAHWACQKGVRQDADAEVVVVARGTLYSKQAVVTRTRVYGVLGDVKWGHAFLPVIMPGSASGAPGGSSKFGAVDWSHFHATAAINMPPLQDMASPRVGSPRVSFFNDLALASAGSGTLSGGTSGTGAGMLAAAGTVEGVGRPPSGARLSQLRPQQQSPMLRNPEHSASTSSLQSAAQAPAAQAPAAQNLLQHHAQALAAAASAAASAFAPDASAPAPLQQQQQPQPAPPPPLAPSRSQKALAMHRSSSALHFGQDRPPAARVFAGPGSATLRRADDDSLAGASDDASEPETINHAVGAQFLRHSSSTATHGHDRVPAGETWHHTRSLFAALEGIQQYLAEQEEEQQRAAAEAERSGGSGILGGADNV